jgi:DNA-directed RNA polymerase specialized sigma24 family protein
VADEVGAQQLQRLPAQPRHDRRQSQVAQGDLPGTEDPKPRQEHRDVREGGQHDAADAHAAGQRGPEAARAGGQSREPGGGQHAEAEHQDQSEAAQARAERIRALVAGDRPDPREEEEAGTLGDWIVIEDAGFAGAEDAVLLEALMRVLPDPERTVVVLRLRDDLLQTEIAELVGVSQMQVSPHPQHRDRAPAGGGGGRVAAVPGRSPPVTRARAAGTIGTEEGIAPRSQDATCEADWGSAA